MHTPLAKTNDPISSHAAGYKFANSEVLKNHEAIILDLLRRFPNRTSKQLAAIEKEESGVDFVGCELDADYYKAACERFDRETRQVALL